jgi:hypothetical protein
MLVSGVRTCPGRMVRLLVALLGCRAGEHWSISPPPRSPGSSPCRQPRPLEVAGGVIFVGDDWSEAHHDVYVCDADGHRLARDRLPEALAGIAAFHAMVAAHADDPDQVVIGIETDRGLWVSTEPLRVLRGRQCVNAGALVGRRWQRSRPVRTRRVGCRRVFRAGGCG